MDRPLQISCAYPRGNFRHEIMSQVKSSRQETYLLSATQLWGINSNEKAFDSTLFGVLDYALGNAPILVDVSARILMECSVFKKNTYNWKSWTCSGRAASTISSNEHEARVGI